MNGMISKNYWKKFKKGAVLAIILATVIAATMAISKTGKEFFWRDSEDVRTKELVQAAPSSFNPVVQKVGPAVVTVYTSRMVDMMSFGRGLPFFWNFGPRERQRELEGAGSGFLITSDGYIVTNAHVVEDAEKIKVQVGEERKDEYEAELIGLDKKTDIALIKIDGKNLPSVVLGDSDGLLTGDWVVAIGSPFGLPLTMSAGIVSFKARDLPLADPRTQKVLFPYTDFIQTDVSINPGNSGGPLVNLKGEVVGINTLIFSRSGGSVGVGFSIPINLAKKILPQLKEKGIVTRSYMGVQIREVDDETAKKMDLDKPKGALVAQVEIDGPADKAGIQVNDIIIEFGGEQVESSRDLPLLVSTYGVGEKAKVVLQRDTERITMSVKLGELPADEELRERSFRGGDIISAENILGLGVKNLGAEDAKDLGYEGLDGVLVVSLKAESPAEKNDIQPGDLIQKINNKKIESVEDFEEAVSSLKKGKMLRIVIRRDNVSILRVFRL